jgi:SAM-dependent methyltransferase
VLDRDEIYTAGPSPVPSEPLVRFALEHAGDEVVDLGCGFGSYSARLQETRKRVIGVDMDPVFVEEARSRGVDAVVGDVRATPFDDRSFDTAILFEVLEHIPQPESVLREALRIVRRNVLVSVPNFGEFGHLRNYGLTYWHVAVTDHVNFFTPEGLRNVARSAGGAADVILSEPLEPFGLVRSRGPAWYALAVLRRVGLIRPAAFFRLYAVVRPADA